MKLLTWLRDRCHCHFASWEGCSAAAKTTIQENLERGRGGIWLCKIWSDFCFRLCSNLKLWPYTGTGKPFQPLSWDCFLLPVPEGCPCCPRSPFWALDGSWGARQVPPPALLTSAAAQKDFVSTLWCLSVQTGPRSGKLTPAATLVTVTEVVREFIFCLWRWGWKAHAQAAASEQGEPLLSSQISVLFAFNVSNLPKYRIAKACYAGTKWLPPGWAADALQRKPELKIKEEWWQMCFVSWFFPPNISFDTLLGGY